MFQLQYLIFDIYSRFSSSLHPYEKKTGEGEDSLHGCLAPREKFSPSGGGRIHILVVRATNILATYEEVLLNAIFGVHSVGLQMIPLQAP